MKTKYESFAVGKLSEGCKMCLKGGKMVLFVTGVCPRNCDYCPLSDKRKNIDKIYANEKECKNFKDIEKEVLESGATGCGVTGGDPLAKFDRTIKILSQLKKRFGKNFHIHIYVSTLLVTEEKIKTLSRVVDEIRFHPDLEKNIEEEIRKISIAEKYFDKKNIGIEIPIFPDKKKDTINFLKKAISHISFLNLNELEIGESNINWINKNYSLNEDTYTINNSLEEGKEIIKKFEKQIRIHLCTAKTKNWYQFRNRLKNYSEKKFFKKTSDGTQIYFSTKEEKIKKILTKENYYFDEAKKQYVINPNKVREILGKLKIFKIEEYPTSDRDIVETEEF